MTKSWKTVSSEVVMETFGVTIRKDRVDLPNGKTIDEYYVFEFKEWATIIPITENHEVVLVQQYRHGFGGVTLEFPAGVIDPEDGSPLEAARRELIEESGYCSDDWIDLGAFSLGPSKIKNQFYLFCARNCRLVHPQKLDEYEDIEVITVPFARFEQLLNEGEIHDVDSALAWLLCRNRGIIQF